ncbi:MAG: DEAD/DEAH box helicase [Nanoarchaeota archaeon]|nr:DEAD/DEAH box helicase [Nanoarchaeota archaeon]
MGIVKFTPREYQTKIFETAKKYNTLVVLPTGIGKTAIALLLAENRLSLYPESKILICCPTKPLCAQHVKSFGEFFSIDSNEIILYTGATNPKKRSELWNNGKIIIATPQTIESDIINSRISLENISLLVLDEAHRSRMKYASTFVAKNYNENAVNKRILALTASPGSTKEKIDEIKNNLFLDTIEIRTETDDDVKDYIQEKEIEWVKVNLPEEFNKIKDMIKLMMDEKINELRRIIPNKKFFNKKDLLALQFQFRKSIMKGNKMAFWGVSLTAQLLKLSHALELIETQGIKQLMQYWDKLEDDKSKAARTIVNDTRIKKAMQYCLDFNESKHPKMQKLKEIVQSELEKNKEAKIIVFANFRNTIDEIYKEINDGLIKPVILVGQKEGLTQKEQIKRIRDFEEGLYNVLIGTSISEEGLDIKGGADMAIFYESVPSEIRMIQRRGRVGRLIKGKIIFLITKKTRDESYYWAAKSKERTMKKTLYAMQEEPKQSKLGNF